MYLWVNGPKGPGGRAAGLDYTVFVNLTVDVFLNQELCKIDTYTVLDESKAQLPADFDIDYQFGQNFHVNALNSSMVNAEQVKDDAATKTKQKLVELGRPIRQTRSDAIKPLSEYEGERDADGHFFIKCRAEGSMMVRRAAFAEPGDLEVEVGDELGHGAWYFWIQCRDVVYCYSGQHWRR